MAEIPANKEGDGILSVIVEPSAAVTDAVERIRNFLTPQSKIPESETENFLTEDQFENIIDILSGKFPGFDPGPRERKQVYESVKRVPATIAYASLSRLLYHPPLLTYTLRKIANYWRDTAAVSG